jgi:hypothetical protein
MPLNNQSIESYKKKKRRVNKKKEENAANHRDDWREKETESRLYMSLTISLYFSPLVYKEYKAMSSFFIASVERLRL